MTDLTCIHTERGLCGACQEEYDADPSSYLDYGAHPAGIANWEALQREMAEFYHAQAQREPVPTDPDIPF